MGPKTKIDVKVTWNWHESDMETSVGHTANTLKTHKGGTWDTKGGHCKTMTISCQFHVNFCGALCVTLVGKCRRQAEKPSHPGCLCEAGATGTGRTIYLQARSTEPRLTSSKSHLTETCTCKCNAKHGTKDVKQITLDGNVYLQVQHDAGDTWYATDNGCEPPCDATQPLLATGTQLMTLPSFSSSFWAKLWLLPETVRGECPQSTEKPHTLHHTTNTPTCLKVASVFFHWLSMLKTLSQKWAISRCVTMLQSKRQDIMRCYRPRPN